MKIRSSLAFVLIMFLVVACAPKMEATSGFGAGAAPQAPQPGDTMELAPSEGTRDQFSQAELTSKAQEISDNDTAVRRIVIKNANLSIVVVDPAKAMDSIAKMAEEMGGFVVTSNLYKTRSSRGVEMPVAEITIRVPAEKLGDAMNQIKALVRDPQQHILSENISGQDVTKEYTDLQSRLKNKELEAERLRVILNEAKRTEDVLSISNQLSSVEEQIEVLKGQIKYYEESAALSAISVRIQSEESVAPLEIAGWKPVGVARDALQALLDTLQFISYVLIWVVIFCLPLSLLVGVPLYFIIRGFLRWKKNRKVRSTEQVSSTPSKTE